MDLKSKVTQLCLTLCDAMAGANFPTEVWAPLWFIYGLPWWLSGKEFACNTGDPGSIFGSGRSPGGGNGNPTPVFLPGKSQV